MTKDAPENYIKYWEKIYDGKLPTSFDVGKNVYDLIKDNEIKSGYITELFQIVCISKSEKFLRLKADNFSPLTF